ncbi:MAG: glycerol-3-phosphate dehydrogenase/oxidase [Alphaproteobacteria bacterium]|nr:glycerol-3-phosphate dehydrogenase/oxidase [Alphaproteobacteria bacterium]
MSQSAYDILVVGGGITGACIMRDAALRGLKVALVEKADFSHATSAATSKLIHGGLRYLRNLEFGLIRESLAERRIWQRIAPHMVSPLPFLLPLRRGNGDRVLDLGLSLYDWLSYDRTWLDDPDQRIPAHSRLSREAAIESEGVLEAPDLKGALLYYDCQTYAPERLGLECIKDGVDAGGVAANYAEVTEFLRHKGDIIGATVRDNVTGETFPIRARVTVNASGPWADRLLSIAQKGKPSHHLIRSKGIHLIVRSLTRTHAITGFVGKRHFFVLPWRGHSILGTTDDVFEGSPDEVSVSEAEIAGFLALVNEGLPASRLTRGDVKHVYAGLRPLVQDGAGEKTAADSYGASRRAEICDHTVDGAPGLISAIGGKWTTSRHIAQKIVDLIVRKLALKAERCQTAIVPLRAGATGRIATYIEIMRSQYATIPRDIVDNLVRNYGAHAQAVIEGAKGDGRLLVDPLAPGMHEVTAQVLYAMRSEMALTLGDVIFRRTGLGTLGAPSARTLERVAEIMAAELNWPKARIPEEIAAVENRFRGLLAGAAA